MNSGPHYKTLLTLAAAVHCACFCSGCSMQNAVALCSVEWVVHQSRTVDSWTANHTKRHLFPAKWNALCPFLGWCPFFLGCSVRKCRSSTRCEVWDSLKLVSFFLADQNPTPVKKLKSSQLCGRWTHDTTILTSAAHGACFQRTKCNMQ